MMNKTTISAEPYVGVDYDSVIAAKGLTVEEYKSSILMNITMSELQEMEREAQREEMAKRGEVPTGSLLGKGNLVLVLFAAAIIIFGYIGTTPFLFFFHHFWDWKTKTNEGMKIYKAIGKKVEVKKEPEAKKGTATKNAALKKHDK